MPPKTTFNQLPSFVEDEDDDCSDTRPRTMHHSCTSPLPSRKLSMDSKVDQPILKSMTEPAIALRRRRTYLPLGRCDSYHDNVDIHFLIDSDDEDLPTDSGTGTAVAWLAGATVLAMCASTIPFEILTKLDRGCTDLIFFGQVSYAALECFLYGDARAFIFDRQIPLVYHLGSLFFERGRIALYNKALDFGLPMPVYLVIKNSGLVVSMGLGWALQRKMYAPKQILGVIVITVGVITATFASRPAGKGPSTVAPIEHGTFIFAIVLMVGGVVVTAMMNVLQERSFSKYGKHFQETMFYSNVLMLPLLIFDFNSIRSHAWTWMATWKPLPLPSPLDVALPNMWLLLLINVLSASVMKLSCMKLTASGGQVSNVITVTVARFLSLVLSAVAMNGPPFPTLSFWLGGVLVLGGTLAYVLAVPAKPHHKKES